MTETGIERALRYARHKCWRNGSMAGIREPRRMSERHRSVERCWNELEKVRGRLRIFQYTPPREKSGGTRFYYIRRGIYKCQRQPDGGMVTGIGGLKDGVRLRKDEFRTTRIAVRRCRAGLSLLRTMRTRRYLQANEDAAVQAVRNS